MGNEVGFVVRGFQGEGFCIGLSFMLCNIIFAIYKVNYKSFTTNTERLAQKKLKISALRNLSSN